MPRYISGRSKITPQTGLTSDRYKYLSVSEAEPNLGDPIVGPSSYTGSVPVGQQYIVVAIDGQDPGERFWIPNQGGIIPGSISVFEEDQLVGGLSSTTQLNFVGQSITAEGIGLPNPGVAVTITVAPPGNPNEVLFVSAGSTDFATDARFIFDDGLLKTGDRITVGTGGTVITTTGIGSVGIGTTQPTEKLHLEGDFRITGTIYDSLNEPGDTGDLIVKTATGGLLWVTPSAVQSGAGGTIGQIQFHNTAGLVDGADNFYFDFNNNRVGIGSTQPTQLLDVLGVSTFSGGVFVDDLSVSGFSTFTEIIDANGGLDVFGHTELDSANVSGLSTFGGNVDINASVDISTNLDVDGTTDLDVLNVAETASFTATTDNTLGNTNTGAVRIDGGVGIDKNLTVGQAIQATNLNITGVGTIAQFDFGVGQFDDITVLGVSTLGNVVVEGNSIKTKTGTGNLTLDSDGASSIVVNDFLFVTKNTESTSKDTGSIITEGGIGVEKSVFVGLNLDVDGSTNLDTLNVSVATTTASLTLANAGIAVTAILDEDDMVSDRDDALATQQSIKSYVDSRVTAQDLDFAGDTGTGNVDLDSQTFTIAGTTNEIETVGSGQTLTIGLPDDVIISNTLTVIGITSLNGNVDLGDAIADSISFIGQVDTDILPTSDGSLDLGSSGKKWDNVYANTFIGTITGNADSANNLSGGTAGDIPYQDGPGSTTFLADPGVSGDGYVLTWNNGSTAPQWSDLTTLGGSGYTISASDNGNDADIVLTDAVGGASSITVTAGSNITIDPVGASGFTISAVDGAGVGVAASASDVLNVNAGQIGGVDPNADRIVFWDDSANKLTYLTAGTGLTISGTTITANSDAGKTYTLDAVDSGDNAILRLSDGSTNEDILITAGSNITIDPVASGGFTINAVAGGGGGGGGGGGELLSDVDVKQYSNNNTPRTEYGCSNPIDVTVSAGTATIGIGSTSNAYGKRYVQETEPTTDVCDGDIWYDLTGTSAVTSGFVTGMIMMFSGTAAPSGWAFCDGNNGTPDLRNRFIIAAHSMSKTGITTQLGPGFSTTTGAVNESGQYEPGDVGGSTAHQLTEDEMPSHVHTGQEAQNIRGSDDGGIRYKPGETDVAMNAAGGDKYHENRPPYYALAFIMKT